MKGILLAGGNGTRLYPLTRATNKHLMNIYDKPMIFYPLSTLMLAGIREIALISSPRDLPSYKQLLGSGEHLGISLTYIEQEKPLGIAQAFTLAETFIDKDSVCLTLGDNIFYGDEFSKLLKECTKLEEGGIMFGYEVNDPERYGVVSFDQEGNVIDIEEKPQVPKSNFAVPGVYFYDNKIVDIAKGLKPSGRGELEITDVNLFYLQMGQLKVKLFGRGSAWLDTGTPDSLLDASNFVGTLEKRQGNKIACLEETAYKMGYISIDTFTKNISAMPNGNYKKYLTQVLKNETASVTAATS
ncbi:glucose-1-phosphate thymidylyltransferase RfbA [Bacillus swezeyi]|uniref:glucose-1-phosphate thymidylyltransferase RfbA n=1 Tax=Bacillus swezeyi TaxID=1925020 RepID=UPI003F89832C